MTLRERLNDAPIIVVALVMAILFGGLSLVGNVATGVTRLNWAAVIGAAVGGLIFGALMSLIIRYQRRRNGGVSMARAVTNAIKSGELPADARPSEWGPLLERRRRQVRLYRWVGPVEFGLFALLGVYLLFAEPGGDVIWGVEILIFLGFLIAYPISAHRQLPRIEALEKQLTQRTTTTA